jgi:acetyltransferase
VVTRQWIARDGTPLTLRPLGPKDAGIAREALRKLSPRTRYLRFFVRGWKLSEKRLARALNPDPTLEYALIVTAPGRKGEVGIGAGHFFVTTKGDEAEFALLLVDEWQRKGIGALLLAELVLEARRRKLKRLHGEILAANAGMLKLVRRLGFAVSTHPDDPNIRLASLDIEARA